MKYFRRPIFSLFFIFSLLLSFSAETQARRRCPIPDPNTLRELYQGSDIIVVGEITDSILDKIVRDDEYGQTIEFRKNFDISETYKGHVDAEPFFIVRDYLRRNESGILESGDEENSRFKKGTKYLFFFRKSESNAGYELSDYGEGAKELSDEDLAIYKLRITELATILKNKRPNPNDLVEWFIKCIEEKATRWEGSFELERSFATLKYEKAEEAEKAKSNEAKTSAANVDDSEETNEYFVGDSVFAKSLSDQQKTYLTSLLLKTDIKILSERTQYSRTDGNRSFLNLVSNWGGKHVVDWLLPVVKGSDSSYSYSTSTYMELIARLLNDSKLSELAEKYDEFYSDEIEPDSQETPDVTIESSEENPKAETKKDVNINEETKVSESDEVETKIDPKAEREKIVAEFSVRTESLLRKTKKRK